MGLPVTGVDPSWGQRANVLSLEETAARQPCGSDPDFDLSVPEPKAPHTELRMRMRELASTRVRYGYRKTRVLLDREGWKVGKSGVPHLS